MTTTHLRAGLWRRILLIVTAFLGLASGPGARAGIDPIWQEWSLRIASLEPLAKTTLEVAKNEGGRTVLENETGIRVERVDPRNGEKRIYVFEAAAPNALQLVHVEAGGRGFGLLIAAGRVRRYVEHVNGVAQGPDLACDDSGAPRSLFTRSAGRIQGPFREWDSKGTLVASGEHAVPWEPPWKGPPGSNPGE